MLGANSAKLPQHPMPALRRYADTSTADTLESLCHLTAERSSQLRLRIHILSLCYLFAYFAYLSINHQPRTQLNQSFFARRKMIEDAYLPAGPSESQPLSIIVYTEL